MTETEQKTKNHGREYTSEDKNLKADQKVVNQIFKYKTLTAGEISERLEKLYDEWDIERILGMNASTLIFSGLALGRLINKAWYILPVVATGFLMMYSLQGWCPPASLLRKLGYRSRQEIDEEIYALKVLRGDFDTISSISGPIAILGAFRK